jgi:hypothetical protein
LSTQGEDGFFSNNGLGPNLRHAAGVLLAIDYYTAAGFSIYSATPVAVVVPGFPTARVYDFVALDPVSGRLIGVEVKTTMRSTIYFDPQQVVKDVVVVGRGGYVATTGEVVQEVGYYASCWGCRAIDFRGTNLRDTLQAIGIGVAINPAPGVYGLP